VRKKVDASPLFFPFVFRPFVFRRGLEAIREVYTAFVIFFGYLKGGPWIFLFGLRRRNNI